MKVVKSILFIYFSLFYILGSDNLNSLFSDTTDEIVYSLKDMKKDSDTDEKEFEEEKIAGIFGLINENKRAFYTSKKRDYILFHDDTVLESEASIDNPPPDEYC